MEKFFKQEKIAIVLEFKKKGKLKKRKFCNIGVVEKKERFTKQLSKYDYCDIAKCFGDEIAKKIIKGE